MASEVLIVLMHHSRPANMPSVIQAWRGQAVPPKHLVVVDNSPLSAETYPKWGLHHSDDVWRFAAQHGCACRLAPALICTDCKYVLFADDDYLPGNKALECLLETAAGLQDRFSTLGQWGRHFLLDEPPGKRYRYGNTAPIPSKPTVVHATCRGHLVQREWLWAAIGFREMILSEFPEAGELVGMHDDLLVCLGLQRYCYGQPSYVLPHQPDPERRMVKEELPAPNAVHQRPGHLAARNRFVDIAIECGWRPVEAP